MDDLDEEEIWNALEQLHAEGKIEHVPGIGSDVDPAFKMTEEGLEDARDLLRENDRALIEVVRLTLGELDRPNDKEAVAEALVDVGEHLRDDVGRNIFRVMMEHPESAPGLDVESLPEEFLEVFDP